MWKSENQVQRWSDVQDGGRQASLRQISLVLTKEIYTRVNTEYTNAQELHFFVYVCIRHIAVI